MNFAVGLPLDHQPFVLQIFVLSPRCGEVRKTDAGDLSLIAAQMVGFVTLAQRARTVTENWRCHGETLSLRSRLWRRRGRCRLILAEVHLGLALQIGGGLGRVLMRLMVLRRRSCLRRRQSRKLPMMFEVPVDAAQNRRIHCCGIIGDIGRARHHVGVLHELKKGCLQQTRMALQETALVIRQAGHGIDVRVNRLPRRRIERRLGKPDLRARRMLTLKMFGVLLGLQGER